MGDTMVPLRGGIALMMDRGVLPIGIRSSILVAIDRKDFIPCIGTIQIVRVVVVPSVRVGTATTMKMFPVGIGIILVIPLSTPVVVIVSVIDVYGSTPMKMLGCVIISNYE